MKNKEGKRNEKNIEKTMGNHKGQEITYVMMFSAEQLTKTKKNDK